MENLTKAKEITNARISFVSLVDAAANKHRFLVTKANDGKASFNTCGAIIKTDADKHYVTGIVFEPLVEDTQGTFMTAEEIEKAAYWYQKNSGAVDLQHTFVPMDGAAVVESWIAKADFTLGDTLVKQGTWLMTIEVTDSDIWEDIEKGDITGLSMGGIGDYGKEDVDLDNLEKSAGTPEENAGILAKIAKALGFKIEKGQMEEMFQQRSQSSLFWNAFNCLEDTLKTYDYRTGGYTFETDASAVREALEDFSNILTEVLTSDESVTEILKSAERPQIMRAGRKVSGANMDRLKCIQNDLYEFIKEFDTKATDEEEEEEDTEVKKSEVEKIVESSIAKALEGFSKGTAATTEGGVQSVEKNAQGNSTPREEVTSEGIEAMVNAAVAKAMQPQEENLTAEQVQDMVTSAVNKAVAPILRSAGVPSNLNDEHEIEKNAGCKQHYMHGIL